MPRTCRCVRCGAATIAAALLLPALAGCGGDRPPTSPTPAAQVVLASGTYRLHIVSAVELSGCVGTATAPVLARTIDLTLERSGGASVIAATTAAQGDLTLRLTERDVLPNARLARIEGTGHGSGHAAAGAGDPELGLRLDGSRLQGAGSAGGASGDISGPIVFITAGEPDVTCAVGRWSMGRMPP